MVNAMASLSSAIRLAWRLTPLITALYVIMGQREASQNVSTNVSVGVNSDATGPNRNTKTDTNDGAQMFTWEHMKTLYGDIDHEKLLREQNLIYPLGGSCNFSEDVAKEIDIRTNMYFPGVCSCNLDCHVINSCCAEKPYSYLPFTCTRLHLLSRNRAAGINLNIIAECPPSATVSKRRKCTTDTFAPVLSHTTKLLYRNIHCGACYEANTNDLEPLEMSLACAANTSASVGLRERITDDMCTVWYNMPHKQGLTVTHSYCQMNPNALVSECNKTGLWKTYDRDIEWGCKHLDMQYMQYKLQFKNVFCYICNPSLSSLTDVTVFDHTDCDPEYNGFIADEVVRLCRTTELHPRLHPFKNVYCLACSGTSLRWRIQDFVIYTNKYIKDSWETLLPQSIVLEFGFETTKGNPLNFIALESSLKRVLSLFEELPKDVFTNIHESFITKETRHNISELTPYVSDITNGMATMCGIDFICNLPDNETVEGAGMLYDELYFLCHQCSCVQSCSTPIGMSCCIDKLIETDMESCKSSTDVFRFNLNPGLDDVDVISRRIVDRCPSDARNSTLVSMCAEQGEAIVSRIPIHAPLKVYKNIYCLFCNMEHIEDELNSTSVMFEINVFCPNYIEPNIAANFDVVLKMVLQFGCDIHFGLPHRSDSCESVDTLHLKQLTCFKDNYWTTYQRAPFFCRDGGVPSLLFPQLMLPYTCPTCTMYALFGCKSYTGSMNDARLCYYDNVKHEDQLYGGGGGGGGGSGYSGDGKSSNDYGIGVNYHALFQISPKEYENILLVKELTTTCKSNETFDILKVSIDLQSISLDRHKCKAS